jgi:ribose 5-phosphate isomerase A
MTAQEDAKKLVARAALLELPERGVIGLGSGSTARLFIDEVGALVRAGRDFRGVPTSDASRAQAEELGIPLLGDDGPWAIDVTVDGADEVDPSLCLIKGGGGAHLREKMINYASKKNVIVVDETKLSAHLGDKWSVPVEVVCFGSQETAEKLAPFGRPVLRRLAAEKGGAVFVTDTRNLIYDVATGPMSDPSAVERAMRAIPGVVEIGLFVGRADVVLVASESGVRRLTRTA